MANGAELPLVEGRRPMTQRERIREKSQRRRAHEKEELRQAILATAAELFVEQGYAGFSMRQVAERLGYTVATLYLYYENKDALLFAVIGDAYAQLDRELAVADDPTQPPRARLFALARAYVAFGLHHPAAYQLMFLDRPDFLFRAREDTSTEPVSNIVGYRVVYGVMRAALAAGAMRGVRGVREGDTTDGEVADAADAVRYADALWAQLHGIVALAIRLPTLFDDTRIQAALDTALAIWLESDTIG